jgi:uncharacterized protein YjdB
MKQQSETARVNSGNRPSLIAARCIGAINRTLIIAGLCVYAIGCGKFFVDPTLSSITVTPQTPSIPIDKTRQMTATGTYNNGSEKNITGEVTWSSSNTSIATVSDNGVVAGVAAGTASITATSGSISGSTTVTITIADLSSIQVTPTNASIRSGQTESFTAIGILQNGNHIDITDAVTWKSSNKSAATISSAGVATGQDVSSAQTTSITATSGSIVSNTATLTVNP